MSYVWVEGLVIEHLEQTSLRPYLHWHKPKLLELSSFPSGRWFRPSPNLYRLPSAATITLRLLVGDLYRLGDLQISKIKRPANQTLSLSEFAQLSSGTLVFSRVFFRGMLRIFSGATSPQMVGGGGVFIGGDPNGEMSDLTRCDSLTRVPNGRNFNHCATLLEEQVSWLTEWILSRRHQVRWLCLRAIIQFDEISLCRKTLSGFWVKLSKYLWQRT
jgi:hypothetical protein